MLFGKRAGSNLEKAARWARTSGLRFFPILFLPVFSPSMYLISMCFISCRMTFVVSMEKVYSSLCLFASSHFCVLLFFRLLLFSRKDIAVDCSVKIKLQERRKGTHHTEQTSFVFVFVLFVHHFQLETKLSWNRMYACFLSFSPFFFSFLFLLS